MRKLAREPCPGDWRNELAPAIAIPVSDVVIEQDEPCAAI
jgi:hypothetical protein